jgi:hypothetical protein
MEEAKMINQDYSDEYKEPAEPSQEEDFLDDIRKLDD